MKPQVYIWAQLAKYPEENAFSQDSLNNVNEESLLKILRIRNAGRNRGELNDQFQEWILNNEAKYIQKISGIFIVGTHKVKLTYYGMIYTILEWRGCFLRGSRGMPNRISRSKFCSYLNLEVKLKSKNIRKVLADEFYGYNYLVNDGLAKGIKDAKTINQLNPIFQELANEVENIFLK